jgi:hypothetical protein
VADLTTPEVLALAVAIGTLLLAAATFWMAKATREMATVSKRQFDASVTPVLRVTRVGQPDSADIYWVNEGFEDEALVLELENQGPTPAEVERCTLGGHIGRIEDPDKRYTPAIGPGEARTFEFPGITGEYKAEIKAEDRVVLVVQYLAVSTHVAYLARTHLTCSTGAGGSSGEEEWFILGEEAPRAVDSL